MLKKTDLENSGSLPLMKLSHNPSHTKKSFLLNYENNESFDLTRTSFMTESWSPKLPTFEYLDLKIFKVFPCNNLNPHNYKTCCYYHNIKDRRRTSVNYISELCEYIEKNRECPKGEMCNRSHNFIEVLYHTDKYKTKFCSFFPNNVHNCEYLQYCSFAHSEHEIIIDLLHNYDFDDDFYMFHYKTVWCPFNLSQHNKALCVYAHNWQDFRRRPDKYLYDYTPCEKWKNNEIILNYENGCHKTYECNKSHGWKESEFHPLNYKTRLCSISKPCTKSKDCPFYHTPAEKRLKKYSFQINE